MRASCRQLERLGTILDSTKGNLPAENQPLSVRSQSLSGEDEADDGGQGAR